MAFALIAIGLLLFIAAYHNNVAALGSQIKSDLVGSQGFLVWVVALFIVGALGYVPALKNVSRVFLVLILVVIFLSNKGVFTTLTQMLGVASSDSSSTGVTGATPATPAAAANSANSVPVTGVAQ